MLVSKTIFVDETFSCKLQIDETGKLYTDWSPQPPKALSKAMLNNYLSGRNCVITEALGMRPDLALTPYRTAEWNINAGHKK